MDIEREESPITWLLNQKQPLNLNTKQMAQYQIEMTNTLKLDF
jgi:hypothetical protein